MVSLQAIRATLKSGDYKLDWFSAVILFGSAVIGTAIGAAILWAGGIL